MITEQHYDEEVLIALLENGDTTLDRDPHITTCRSCSTTLASVRNIASYLAAPGVWDSAELSAEPNPAVLAALRDAQSEMRFEDAAAECFVKQLLAGPRETWAASLSAHPEWRTAGTVRKLIEATDRAIETMPPDAVEITALAVDIAESLGSARLTAHAWRERAYALYFTGAYGEALAAVGRAEAALQQVEPAAAAFDRARLTVVLALIENEREQFSAAIKHAKEAAATFEDFGQHAKYVAAVWAEGSAYHNARRFDDAVRVFKSLLSQGSVVSAQQRAALWANIGLSYAEKGDHVAAREHYGKALIAFDQLHMIVGRAKARWNVARTLIAEARYREALAELVAVKKEFEDLGMINDVAMTSLDVAETYVALGRVEDAAAVCAGTISYFNSAGLEHGSGALTALSYLQEAIACGRGTRTTISHVRGYLSRLATSPAILFAPPPEPTFG